MLLKTLKEAENEFSYNCYKCSVTDDLTKKLREVYDSDIIEIYIRQIVRDDNAKYPIKAIFATIKGESIGEMVTAIDGEIMEFAFDPKLSYLLDISSKYIGKHLEVEKTVRYEDWMENINLGNLSKLKYISEVHRIGAKLEICKLKVIYSNKDFWYLKKSGSAELLKLHTENILKDALSLRDTIFNGCDNVTFYTMFEPDLVYALCQRKVYETAINDLHKNISREDKIIAAHDLSRSKYLEELAKIEQKLAELRGSGRVPVIDFTMDDNGDIEICSMESLLD